MRFLLRLGLLSILRVSFRVVFEPRLPLWLRLVPVIAALYFFSPIDILPDIIGIKGRIDDLFVLIFSTILLLVFIPRKLFLEFLGKDSSTEDAGDNKKVVEGSYRYLDEDP